MRPLYSVLRNAFPHLTVPDWKTPITFGSASIFADGGSAIRDGRSADPFASSGKVVPCSANRPAAFLRELIVEAWPLTAVTASLDCLRPSKFTRGFDDINHWE